MSAITTSTAARDERLADVIQFLAHGLGATCASLSQTGS
jgi:hypothetical protein